jgi:hypothetical protein
LLLGHEEAKQIGVVLLGGFRRLYAFEPEHDAVTGFMMCPADQRSKLSIISPCPLTIFARRILAARDKWLTDIQPDVVLSWI